MSEIVEAVARAIYEAEKPNHHAGWEVFSKIGNNRDFQMKIARAAIEAMREPTEKMINRGYATRPTKACWQAMIDAALADGK
jgi:hypothetical protein